MVSSQHLLLLVSTQVWRWTYCWINCHLPIVHFPYIGMITNVMAISSKVAVWMLSCILCPLWLASLSQLLEPKNSVRNCMCIFQATRAQLILKTDITKLNATNKGLENKLKCARIVEKNKEKDIQWVSRVALCVSLRKQYQDSAQFINLVCIRIHINPVHILSMSFPIPLVATFSSISQIRSSDVIYQTHLRRSFF